MPDLEDDVAEIKGELAAMKVQQEFDAYKAANPPKPEVDVKTMTPEQFKAHKASILKATNARLADERSARAAVKNQAYLDQKAEYFKRDPKTRGRMPERPN
jgi:hypothetical protein